MSSVRCARETRGRCTVRVRSPPRHPSAPPPPLRHPSPPRPRPPSDRRSDDYRATISHYHSRHSSLCSLLRNHRFLLLAADATSRMSLSPPASSPSLSLSLSLSLPRAPSRFSSSAPGLFFAPRAVSVPDPRKPLARVPRDLEEGEDSRG